MAPPAHFYNAPPAGIDPLSPDYLFTLYAAELPLHLSKHAVFTQESIDTFRSYLKSRKILPEIYGQWLNILASKFCNSSTLEQLTLLVKETIEASDRNLVGWGMQTIRVLLRYHFEQTIDFLGGVEGVSTLIDALPVVDVRNISYAIKEAATRSASSKSEESRISRRNIVDSILEQLLPSHLSRGPKDNEHNKRNLFEQYQTLLVASRPERIHELLPKIASHIRPHVWKELVREHPATIAEFVLEQLEWERTNRVLAMPRFLKDAVFELARVDRRGPERFDVEGLKVNALSFAPSFGLSFLHKWLNMLEIAKKDKKVVPWERMVLGDQVGSNVDKLVHLIFQSISRDWKGNYLDDEVAVLGWVIQKLEKLFGLLRHQNWVDPSSKIGLFRVSFSIWGQSSYELFAVLLKHVYAPSCFPLTSTPSRNQMSLLDSLPRDKRFETLRFIHLHLPHPYAKDILSLPSASLTLEQQKSASIAWSPTILLKLSSTDAIGCLERSRKYLAQDSLNISDSWNAAFRSIQEVIQQNMKGDVDSLGVLLTELRLKTEKSTEELVNLLLKKLKNEADATKRAQYAKTLLNASAFSDRWDIFEKNVRWLLERFLKDQETRLAIVRTLHQGTLCPDMLTGIPPHQRHARVTSAANEKLDIDPATVEAANTLLRFICIDFCSRCIKEANWDNSEYQSGFMKILRSVIECRAAYVSKFAKCPGKSENDIKGLAKILLEDMIPVLLDFEKLRLFEFRNQLVTSNWGEHFDNQPLDINFTFRDVRTLPHVLEFFDKLNSRRDPLWRTARLRMHKDLSPLPNIFPVGLGHCIVLETFDCSRLEDGSQAHFELEWTPWMKDLVERIVFQTEEEIEQELEKDQLEKLNTNSDDFWRFIKLYCSSSKDPAIREQRIMRVLQYWFYMESPREFVQRDFRVGLTEKFIKWLVSHDNWVKRCFSPRILKFLFATLPELPVAGKPLTVISRIPQLHSTDAIKSHRLLPLNDAFPLTWQYRFGQLSEYSVIGMFFPFSHLRAVYAASFEVKKLLALESYLLLKICLQEDYSDFQGSIPDLGVQLVSPDNLVPMLKGDPFYRTVTRILGQFHHLLPGGSDDYWRLLEVLLDQQVEKLKHAEDSSGGGSSSKSADDRNGESSDVNSRRSNLKEGTDAGDGVGEGVESGPEEAEGNSVGTTGTEEEDKQAEVLRATATPELLIRLLRALAFSQSPQKSLPIIARVLRESCFSSWHRWVLTPTLLARLPRQVAAKLIKDVYSTMEGQWTIRGKKKDEPLVKMSTIKFIPQLLKGTAVLPPLSLLSYFTKPSRLIAHSSLFTACATGFMDTFLKNQDVVGSIQEVWDSFNYFVTVASRFNENVHVTENDWEAISAGSKALPEYNDSRPVFNLLTSYHPVNLPESLLKPWGDILFQMFARSAENNKRWMKQFITKKGGSAALQALEFPPMSAHTDRLSSVFETWYRYLPVGFLSLVTADLKGGLVHNTLQPFTNSLTERDAKWRSNAEGKIWSAWDTHYASAPASNFASYHSILLRDDTDASVLPAMIHNMLLDVAKSYLVNQYSIKDQHPLSTFRAILGTLRLKYSKSDDGAWFSHSRRMVSELADVAKSLPLLQQPVFVDTFDLNLLPFPRTKPFSDNPLPYAVFAQEVSKLFQRIVSQHSGRHVYFTRAVDFLCESSLYKEPAEDIAQTDFFPFIEALLIVSEKDEAQVKAGLSHIVSNLLVSNSTTWKDDEGNKWVTRKVLEKWEENEDELLRELAWSVKGRKFTR
ncbi:hypothetical protein BT69DRAFT_1278880 [Atractiella rhizophila]|nr:hypothetical protein BT69DRAFT_1278880 [Atractiella rhizophila]